MTAFVGWVLALAFLLTCIVVLSWVMAKMGDWIMRK